jgi:hypothetical protein
VATTKPGRTYVAGHLACDRCGGTSAVKIRECHYRVMGHSLTGPRVTLPYCVAPALCAYCFSELAENGLVHGEQCRAGAQASQRHADAVEAQLDAGDCLPVAVWGDEEPHPQVPHGWVGVMFRSRAGDTYHLVRSWYWTLRVALSAVDERHCEPWTDHP